MKRYIKDGKIKARNQIVIRGTRTIEDGNGIERVISTNTFNPTEDMILADGWEEYIAPSVPEPTEEEIEARNTKREIENEKDILASTDYKVIKCMEAYLCGQELPYDIRGLHLERESHRERINHLEGN
jgi:hypothetical protein